jgi:hypothetical protein
MQADRATLSTKTVRRKGFIAIFSAAAAQAGVVESGWRSNTAQLGHEEGVPFIGRWYRPIPWHQCAPQTLIARLSLGTIDVSNRGR